MISTRRNIASGTTYNGLFTPATNTDIEIKSSANVDDTIRLIKKIVGKTLDQTASISKKLKRKSILETCRAIWHFVYNHIDYVPDEDGIEQVRHPRRLWSDRYGDCDCFTVFISSILTNMNIPHILRVTDNFGEGGWNHIYPVAFDEEGNEIYIDCVLHEFNKEHHYYDNQDYNMKLHELGKLPTVTDNKLCGCGCGTCEDRKQVETFIDSINNNEELGNIFKKIWSGIKTVVVSPFRNAFLLVMKSNMKQVAAKIRWGLLTQEEAAKYGYTDATKWRKVAELYKKVSEIHKKAGGDRSKLRDAIFNGSGNKNPKLPTPSGRISPVLNGVLPPQGYELQMRVRPLTEQENKQETQAIARQVSKEIEYASKRSQAVAQFKNFVASRCDQKTQESLQGLFGLGTDPATATAIASVMAALAPIIALLNKLVANGDPQKAEVDSSNYGLSPEEQKELEASMANLNSEVNEAFNANITDPNAKGEPQKENGIIGWVKENPITSALLGLGLGLGTFAILKPSEPDYYPPPRQYTPRSRGNLNGASKKTTKKSSSKTRKTTSKKKVGSASFSGLK
ncbi:hypothetical protein [Bernardetia sp.]|uniref:hypothetical protein n=1 Tax=Bernardetia sp. TaxID=1937974 RepID=UPI0025C6710A|nr:hypothetical protein [Bernardetia sp.]